MKGWIALVLAVVLGRLAFWALDHPQPEPPASPLSLQGVLGQAGGEANGFAVARPGHPLQFPEDHAAHPAFRSEWWYLTGNLQRSDGERAAYGFQLTLFRLAQFPPAAGDAQTDNPWLSGQLYLGHLALTSVADRDHRAAERATRAGPGLAGSGLEPPRIWLGPWRLQAEQPGALFPLRLQAADPERGIGLDLRLEAQKPRVLQGEQGFSPKNAAGGGSYYYSYTRLDVEGALTWEGQPRPVTGQAWYDHEWSSNSLAPGQQGWDWFALQLDDGRELMLYRFRRDDNRPGWRQALLVGEEGEPEPLAPEQWRLEVLAHWQSPGGRNYPARWRVRVPGEGLDLEIEPRVADQEMDLAIPYWEGAVTVTGSHPGLGYVELVGY